MLKKDFVKKIKSELLDIDLKFKRIIKQLEKKIESKGFKEYLFIADCNKLQKIWINEKEKIIISLELEICHYEPKPIFELHQFKCSDCIIEEIIKHELFTMDYEPWTYEEAINFIWENCSKLP